MDVMPSSLRGCLERGPCIQGNICYDRSELTSNTV